VAALPEVVPVPEVVVSAPEPVPVVVLVLPDVVPLPDRVAPPDAAPLPDSVAPPDAAPLPDSVVLPDFVPLVVVLPLPDPEVVALLPEAVPEPEPPTVAPRDVLPEVVPDPWTVMGRDCAITPPAKRPARSKERSLLIYKYSSSSCPVAFKRPGVP
jgi:hypothetical protein